LTSGVGGCFKKFDTSGKSPAYRHHRKNCKSPRRKRPRVFAFGFPESDGGRISRAHHLLKSSASSQDAPQSAPPSEPLLKLAGARERDGTRCGQGPRPHAASLAEIGFAPEMTVRIRSCRIFGSDQARRA
jgi:hypothetical protein